jgi:hypothetical protein
MLQVAGNQDCPTHYYGGTPALNSNNISKQFKEHVESPLCPYINPFIPWVICNELQIQIHG